MSDNSIPKHDKQWSTDSMIRPQDKQPILPHEYEAPSVLNTAPEGGGELSTSAWAKMFPHGATKQELKQFITTFLKDLICQMRHQDEIHKQHMRELRDKIEGS